MASPSVHRLDTLTGLRWWAAVGVFFFHFQLVGHFSGVSYLTMGYTGVAFFFVLSGFVLTWSARPSVTPAQFYIRRIARVWPAHLVAMVAAMFVTYGVIATAQGWTRPFSWAEVGVSTFLLQGFFLDPQLLAGPNGAAWTLSCEAVFYLLHPIVNPMVARLRGRGLATLLIAVIAVGLPSAFADLHAPMVLIRLWEFFLGMICAHMVRRGVRVRIPMAACYLVVGALAWGYWRLVVNPVVPDYAPMIKLLFGWFLPVVYMVVIGAAATADLAGKRTGMKNRATVIGGEWSYAFYLAHATVLYGYHHVVNRPLGAADAVGVFVAVVIAAGLLHLGVEKPCERRLRAWGDRRYGVASLRPAAAPSPTAESAAPARRAARHSASPRR